MHSGFTQFQLSLHFLSVWCIFLFKSTDSPKVECSPRHSLCVLYHFDFAACWFHLCFRGSTITSDKLTSRSCLCDSSRETLGVSRFRMAPVVGSLPPPPGKTPNFEHPKDVLRTVNFVTQSLCISLVTILVLIRVYTRAVIQKIVYKEDCKCDFNGSRGSANGKNDNDRMITYLFTLHRDLHCLVVLLRRVRR